MNQKRFLYRLRTMRGADAMGPKADWVFSWRGRKTYREEHYINISIVKAWTPRPIEIAVIAH